jgi:subtilisin family serine protease
MKKLIILFFAISVAAFGQQHSESLEGKIILMLKNNTTFSDSIEVDVEYKTGNVKIDEINRLHQFTSVTKQRLGRKTNKYTYIIQFSSTTNLKPIIDAYYETGEIEYAEPDYVGTLGGVQEVIPNDQYYFRQWGLHNDGTFPPGLAVAGCDLDMQNAWEIEQGDSSITVGILDTGVKFDHPELADRTWINYNEIPGNLIDDDANGYIDDVKGWNFAGSNNNPVDGHGHGTNIAGIIGANSNNAIGYCGVDWNCKLMILKGFTDGGGGNVSWWANAIYYAVDNGARVINMSFGITNNSITLEDAVNYALENNVVLVACMMNENSSTVFYPAGYHGVIAVGSTDWNDIRSQPFFNGSPGSNYGSHISVVAPGNVIFGLDYLSNTNYEIHFSGTSQATANVSGVASLLLAQDPNRTPGDIKYILEATAEDMVGNPIEDTPGWDQYYGFGRVNAYYALLSSQPCLPEGITFETQEQIDNFQTNYPGCTEIEGDVEIDGNNIENLNGLIVLTSIGGSLWIEDDESLTSLNGLNNLTFIGGNLRIEVSHELINFTGLEGLTYIGGNFEIRDDFVLSDLTGLDNLASIGGYLSIGPMPLGGSGPPTINPNTTLTSLTGLNSLTSIGGDLNIYGNDALTNLVALENLTSIGGDLEIGNSLYDDLISGNSSLTSLMGMENIDAGSINNITIVDNNSLTTCGVQSICDYLASPNGSVNIYGNATGCNNPAEIANSCGFILDCLPYGNYYVLSQAEVDNFQIFYPGCTQLQGKVVISGSDITNLNGLSNITSVGEDLIIYDNELLTSFSGLDGLQSIGGGLKIGIPAYMEYLGNPALTDISGLDNIDPNSLEELVIIGNNSLSDCDIYSICQYLNGLSGFEWIEDNAPGCNSPEEVIEACLTPVEEVAGETGIRIIPNPARDLITVSLPMLIGIAQLTLFNITGEKLIEKQITQAETQIDISALPRGVYFVRVQDEKMIEVTKLIKQ